MTWGVALLQILFAAVGTSAFSVLFSVSKKHCFSCGITGGLGWIVYLLSMFFTNSSTVSTFLSAFALTAIARWFSTLRRAPATVFLLSGIFTLVPGAGIYYTTFHIFMNQPDIAMNHGDHTIKLAICIAFGIAVGYLLPSALFGWGSSKLQTAPVPLPPLEEILAEEPPTENSEA